MNESSEPAGVAVDRDVGRPCVNEALLCLDIGNARDKLHAEVIRAELGRLRAEVEALRSLCAAAYQIVGAADGPVRMMDNLSAAASGLPLPHDPMAGLPWTPNAELSGAGSRAATEPGRSPASDLSA
jgi:hypothetical protein